MKCRGNVLKTRKKSYILKPRERFRGTSKQAAYDCVHMFYISVNVTFKNIKSYDLTLKKRAILFWAFYFAVSYKKLDSGLLKS